MKARSRRLFPGLIYDPAAGGGKVNPGFDLLRVRWIRGGAECVELMAWPEEGENSGPCFTNHPLAGSSVGSNIGRMSHVDKSERDVMKFGKRKVWMLSVLASMAAAGLMMMSRPLVARSPLPVAPNTLSDAEKQAGWVLLFDGKSLDGWRNYKKQTISDKWQVKDGTIVLAGKGGGDIITKEQYEWFELSLDYKISKGGNSGLMFRVTETEGAPFQTGPEVQVQDNENFKDPQLSGWLYQLYSPPKDEKTGKPIDTTKPLGEWNQLRLILAPDKSEVYMNGVKYYEFVLGSDDWNQKVAKSKFAGWKNFGKAPRGHIDLQDHGNEVAFRNIKIRPIDGKKVAAR